MIESTQYLLPYDGADELLVRRWPGAGEPVLYIHGATFPSAPSVGYRFGEQSWAEHLHCKGFDVWAFDFLGFGGSSRPTSMQQPATNNPPIGRAPEAARQIGAVVDHIQKERGGARVHMVAHSWGSIATGRFAGEHPDRVGRLVFFGPIARRQMAGLPVPERIGGWRCVSISDQLARFVEDVPADHPPVLIEPELAKWAPAYLATDSEAAGRTPAAVKIPNGPQADIIATLSGQLFYEPADVVAPTRIVRGAWDNLCGDADASWLMGSLGAKEKSDVVVPEATHLMHLEHGREGLFAATAEWLMKPSA